MYYYEDYRDKLNKKEHHAKMEKIINLFDNAKGVTVIVMADLVQGLSGDSWENLAIVDRMTELGILRELERELNPSTPYRLFCKGRHFAECNARWFFPND